MRRSELVWIEGVECPPQSVEPAIQPLMVTSLGRTGTTLLVRLLAEHPGIMAHKEYPYETRAAGYWMAALKVLADPCGQEDFSPPEIHDERSWVGHHPFHGPPLTSLAEMRDWFDRTYIRELGSFFRRTIDSFYAELACAQGEGSAAFFVEKFAPNHVPWIVWSVYPNARELILIRDPRDVVSSILAFNRKRGYQSFGREKFESDAAFVESLRPHLENLVDSWQSREALAHLVRYEDLVERPIATLAEVFTYLGVDSSRSTVEAIARSGGKATSALVHHRTSSDAASSVGRWRRDLDPALQKICEHAFDDILEKLGYREPNARPAVRQRTTSVAS